MFDLPFGLPALLEGPLRAGAARRAAGRALDGAIDPDLNRGSILIEAIHGAATRVPRGVTPVGFRDAAFNISALGIWSDPATDGAQIAWARTTASLAAPHSLQGGGYVNYMQADEPVERVRAAFGADVFERLRTVKRQYDPGNVLRFNQNIPPG